MKETIDLQSGTYILKKYKKENIIKSPFGSEEDLLKENLDFIDEDLAILFGEEFLEYDSLEDFKRKQPKLYEKGVNYIKKSYKELLSQFNERKNPFLIYRGLSSVDIDEIKRKIEKKSKMGEYWTLNYNIAKSFGKWKGNKEERENIILFGYIFKENVDWRETLLRNINPATREEQEIRILDDTKITIEKIEIMHDKFIILKKTERNFMRIRILDPDPSLWYSIKKKGKDYYIVKDNEKGSSKFITLDIGDLEKKGIQGIAFIRGVPKELKLSIGHKIMGVTSKEGWNNNWRSQSIRIEYKIIKTRYSDKPEKQIEFALKKYKRDIIKFLEREYSVPIKQIIICKKERDFKLDIEFQHECIYKERIKIGTNLIGIKNNSGYIEVSYSEEYGSIQGYCVNSEEEQVENWFKLRNKLGNEVDYIIEDIKKNYKIIGFINNISVEEDMRGEGYGTELMNSFIEEAEYEGAEIIILLSDKTEEQKEGFDLDLFYENLGFEKIFKTDLGYIMMKKD